MKGKIDEKGFKNEEIFLRSFIFVAASFALLSVVLSQYFEVKESILTEARRLNITANCNESLLVFNRVPKVINLIFFYLADNEQGSGG